MAGKTYSGKLDLLQWMWEQQRQIETYELADHFDLTRGSAKTTLSRLKKARLVVNMTRGRWELTWDGLRKLERSGRA